MTAESVSRYIGSLTALALVHLAKGAVMAIGAYWALRFIGVWPI